ncbi:MAG: putative porin [Bacteroidota bacterium]
MSKQFFISVIFSFFLLTESWAQIPDLPDRDVQRDEFGNPIEDEFGNIIGQDSVTTQKDEKGRLLLEPVPEEIYSTRTSGFIYEEDWLFNRKTEHYFDSTLHNLHRYNFIDKNNFMYQDLGNLGTAIQSIFYEAPRKIGNRLGINNLDPMLFNESNIQFLDTKSPFTSWHYVQGAGGRSIIDVHHSQNVKPNWNVGLRIYRINARLLVGTEPANQNDRQVTHENYVFKTRFESNNKRYRMLFYAQSLKHLAAETGGLQLSGEDSLLLDSTPQAVRDAADLDLESLDDLFRIDNSLLENRLSIVESLQRDDQARLFHEYTFLGKQGLQLFHIFDYSKKKYKYFDESFQSNSTFYEAISDVPISNAATYTHTQRFYETQNTLGLKGRAEKLFYLFYLKQSNFKYHFQIAPDFQIPRELSAQRFFGFKGAYDLSPSIRFRGDYEGLLGSDTGVKVYAEMKTPLLTVSHRRISAEPSLMEQYYFGEVFSWDNTLEDDNGVRLLRSTSFTETEVSAPLLNKKVILRPFAKYATFDDYIYFDAKALPNQHGETITVLQAGLDMETHFSWLHQRIFGIYTLNDTESIIRMPEIFANYQIYYQGNPFRFPILIQTGFDFHWNSAFFADAYMPVTQQFHLQNDLELGNYLRGDFFLNFQMKKVVMFFKMTNALQGIQREGYFVTPIYMGQPRTFEFGVTWLMYD